MRIAFAAQVGSTTCSASKVCPWRRSLLAAASGVRRTLQDAGPALELQRTVLQLNRAGELHGITESLRVSHTYGCHMQCAGARCTTALPAAAQAPQQQSCSASAARRPTMSGALMCPMRISLVLLPVCKG